MTMARLCHIARIWRQLMVQYTSVTLAYRAQSLIWMIGGLMPLAMMLIWMELAAHGPINANGISYTQQDFAIYFMGMYLVRQGTVMWCVLLLDRGIRRGELAPVLLRPVPPVWAHMAEHLSEIVFRLPILLVVAAIGLSLTGSWSHFSLGSLPLFFLASAGAWLIFFHIHYCVGLLAFWMEGVLSLEPLIWYFSIILGGGAIPLDLFPAAVRNILSWLPFAAMFDFPVQLLLGKIGTSIILLGFAKQIAWIAAMTALRHSMWRAGLKRYSAMGV